MTFAIEIPKRPMMQMLSVEGALVMLAKCTRVDEAKQIEDQAAAMRVLLRKRGAAVEIINKATQIMLLAQARMGEIIETIPAATPTERVSMRKDRTGAKLAPVKRDELARAGVTKRDASRYVELAKHHRSGALDEHIKAVAEENRRLSTRPKIGALAEEYDSDEWHTPPEIIERVRRVFGGSIDVDPASNARANELVKAAQFFAKEDDGLEQLWEGDVFLNPPYSQPLCSRFVAKFLAEHEAGHISGIVLLNASTDTAWFHALAHRCLFALLAGRISFLRSDGRPVSNNRVGQVVFYTGEDPHGFAQAFEDLGIVCRR